MNSAEKGLENNLTPCAGEHYPLIRSLISDLFSVSRGLTQGSLFSEIAVIKRKLLPPLKKLTKEIIEYSVHKFCQAITHYGL